MTWLCRYDTMGVFSWTLGLYASLSGFRVL
jgi:hypothetical protein